MDKAEFVVVSNRLPVDHVIDADGEPSLAAGRPAASSPRSSRSCAAPTAPGSAGPASPTSSSSRSRSTASQHRAGAAERRGHRALLRGLLATTRSGRCTTTSSPPPRYHRVWWDAYVRVNQRFADAAAAVAADGRDRLGAGLPAAARAADAARAAARPHDRLLPPHPVPGIRHLLAAAVAPQIIEACSAPTSSASSGWRTPATSPARCAASSRYDTKARSSTVPERRRRRRGASLAKAFPISIDSASLRRARAARPTSRRARREIRDEPRQPEDDHARRRPARLHEGHRPPPQGVRRAARRGPPRRRGRHTRAGREPEPRARRGLHAAARRDRADGRPHQRRLRHDRPHGDPLPAPRRTRARRWWRSTSRPTSCSSRPCATA